jgi:hypothetical protein
LFDYVCQHSDTAPPVIDSQDVLANPRGVLSALCKHIGVTFDEAMLSWPAGPRESDGNWAKYWYASVEKSTGFMPVSPDNDDPVPDQLQPLVDACLPLYETMRDYAITAI